MFYIFIFESIGTSELMLIGLVALIVFGPRKLPELARTLGKTMAEFRRSTDDFKKTWQQELDLEEAKKSFEQLTNLQDEDISDKNFIISRDSPRGKSEIAQTAAPEIKEISEAAFNENFAVKKISESNQQKSTENKTAKQTWL